jgi:hypothetical protein
MRLGVEIEAYEGGVKVWKNLQWCPDAIVEVQIGWDQTQVSEDVCGKSCV